MEMERKKGIELLVWPSHTHLCLVRKDLVFSTSIDECSWNAEDLHHYSGACMIPTHLGGHYNERTSILVLCSALDL